MTKRMSDEELVHNPPGWRMRQELNRCRASEKALLKALKGAWHALLSVLAERQGITDELLLEVVTNLGEAIADAEAQR